MLHVRIHIHYIVQSFKMQGKEKIKIQKYTENDT